MRNTFKPGDRLAVCDQDGFTYYASEMAVDWDGSFRHRKNLDGRHPQLDVKARRDPEAQRDVRERPAADSGGDFVAQEDGVLKFVLEESSGASYSFLLCETITVR